MTPLTSATSAPVTGVIKPPIERNISLTGSLCDDPAFPKLQSRTLQEFLALSLDDQLLATKEYLFSAALRKDKTIYIKNCYNKFKDKPFQGNADFGLYCAIAFFRCGCPPKEIWK